jgi:hypothetical protein
MPWFKPEAGLLAILLLGCAPPEETAPVVEIPRPIVGGRPAGTCQWPTAVGAEICTSTLVHPRVITTAAHCVRDGGPSEITFGETWTGDGVVRRVPVKECHTADDSGIPGDFGFCVLAEPVEDVPIVPVLFGCETAVLQPGQGATLVGFGQQRWYDLRAGVKYLVDVAIDDIVDNDVYLGNGRTGACNGDSGGPAYVRLADGSWRVFGATSRGSFFCNSQTIYTLIPPFVPWLERTSGIDITPCHDADGTWHPTAACGRFPLDPGAGGSWSNMCNDLPRGGPSATCGAPFSP